MICLMCLTSNIVVFSSTAGKFAQLRDIHTDLTMLLVDVRILSNRASVLLGNCLFCKCQMIPWVVGEIPFQFLYSWLTKRRFCSMFLPFKKGLSVTTNGLYLTLIQSSEDLTFFISF